MLAGAEANFQPERLNAGRKLSARVFGRIEGELGQKRAAQLQLPRRQFGTLAPAIKLAALALCHSGPHLSLSRKRSETSSPASGSAARAKKVWTKTHFPSRLNSAFELLSQIGFLPRKPTLAIGLAAEMAICRCARIDRLVETQ